MTRNLIALATGVLFGFGLALSQMVNPAKVIGFLDVAGDWDPTLAFVMGGGLVVTVAAFRPILRRGGPVFDARFLVPTRRDIDGRLVGGSALFGVGWGLVGLCPGPAIAALAFAMPQSLVFLAALAAGSVLARARPAAPADAPTAAA